jgi:hypothetical protein
MRRTVRLRLPVPNVPLQAAISTLSRGYFRPSSAGPVAVITFRGQVIRQWNRWGGKHDKSPPVNDFFAAPTAD